jgi:hypothetical protein
VRTGGDGNRLAAQVHAIGVGAVHPAVRPLGAVGTQN